MATPLEEAEMLLDKAMDGVEQQVPLASSDGGIHLAVIASETETTHSREFTLSDEDTDWKHKRYRLTIEPLS